MLGRVKQFFSADTARLTAADLAFIADYLTPVEQELFRQMSLPDRCHALDVAYTAAKLMREGRNINSRLLIKSALLHDVGKVRGDVSTWDKVVTVLAHGIAPVWAQGWGRLGRGNMLDNIRHAFFIYFNHAGIGAEKLQASGTEPAVIALVRKHHEAPAEDDPPELILLRRADEMN